MDLKLSNKVAIVTGASRGIGESISKKLASNGVKVAIISRNLDALNQVASNIDSKYILPLECDVTDFLSFQKICGKI